MESVQLDDKRTINAWALFDWANSAYALVITAAIFPGYYSAVTDEVVNFFGVELKSSALYSFSISAAYIMIAISSPFLSGIADYGGKKKFFLKIFTTLGALSCVSLWWFRGMEQLELGTIAFVLATVGFTGGLVFYNSYLPIIASKGELDRVSAKGFSYGYVGSVLLLIVNLAIIMNYEALGFEEEGTAVRLAFVMVGVWWLGFAQIPFRRLPKDENKEALGGLAKKGFQEVKKVWKLLKKLTQARRFLYSFFLYNAAAQTVIFLAAMFAKDELGFATTDLIVLILVLQIVGIAGAYLFSRISKLKGNKFSLTIILMIWVLVCVSAYFVTESIQFYMVSAGVGLVMGGVQSLSRSTYSKLLPEGTEDTASWFSFYEITDKVGVVVGTVGFGVINQMSGMRNSILFLAVFFLIGLIVLQRVTIQTKEQIADGQ